MTGTGRRSLEPSTPRDHRTRRWNRAAPLAAAAALALASGCAATGTFTESPRLDPELLEAGIRALAQEPMLAYEGTQSKILTDDSAEAEVSWTVTSNGLALGGIRPVDWHLDHECMVAEVPEGVFVYLSHGCNGIYREGITPEAGQQWAFMEQDMWFEPGEALAPAVFAEALGQTIARSSLLAEPLPPLEDLDGVPVYPLEVGGGTLYLTEDGTIALIEQVHVEMLGGMGWGITATVEPGAATPTLIADLGGELNGLVASWDEALYIGNASFEDDVENESAGCNVLVCTVESDIAWTESSGNGKVDALTVEYTGEITTDVAGVGSSTCTQTQTVQVGESAHFECVVDLSSMLDPTLEYWLTWDATTAFLDMSMSPDIPAITAGVEEQIDLLTG